MGVVIRGPPTCQRVESSRKVSSVSPPPHSFIGSVQAGGGGRARPLPTLGTPRRAGGSRTLSRPAPTRSSPAPTRPSRRRRSPPDGGPAAAAAPPILFCSALAGRIPRADPTYPQRQLERAPRIPAQHPARAPRPAPLEQSGVGAGGLRRSRAGRRGGAEARRISPAWRPGAGKRGWVMWGGWG